MKNSLLIISSTLLILACDSTTEKKEATLDSLESTTASSPNTLTERFFPESKGIVKFDTAIADQQLQITIVKTDLDSYAVNEYEDNGNKVIDKYRDATIKLTIKQKSQILLDTVFEKQQFSKYADKEFLYVAIFHNYWLKKIESNRIEFSGVIAKPETDWAIDFNHYFDLTSKTLVYKPIIHDED